LQLGPIGPIRRDGKKHIGMAWSAGLTPANQILAFQFPANIINRERKRSSDQISSIKHHGFSCGLMAVSDLVGFPILSVGQRK
jgi:hypothetical protein